MVDESDKAYPHVIYANQKEAERRARGSKANHPFVSIGVGLLLAAAAWMQFLLNEINWTAGVFFSLAACFHFWQALCILRLKPL